MTHCQGTVFLTQSLFIWSTKAWSTFLHSVPNNFLYNKIICEETELQDVTFLHTFWQIYWKTEKWQQSRKREKKEQVVYVYDDCMHVKKYLDKS
jgi:hypothetical protein